MKGVAIALGGMVPITTSKLSMWLDMVFSKYPNKKFHGFGLTTQKLVTKYPWYSVDSSSWLSGARAGTLFDLKLGNRHYDDINEIWEIKIKERGFTVNEIKTDYRKRTEFNIITYIEMKNNKKDIPFIIRQKQLFESFNNDEYDLELLRKEYPTVPIASLKLIQKQRGETNVNI